MSNNGQSTEQHPPKITPEYISGIDAAIELLQQESTNRTGGETTK